MGGYNAAGAIRTVMVPQISIVSDGDRRLMKVGPWSEVQSDGAMPEGYVTDAGVTPDIAQAADLRGPAVITTIGTPSDPSGGLTLDPSTGDVFQSTGS